MKELDERLELTESPEQGASVYTLETFRALFDLVCHHSIKRRDENEEGETEWEIEPDRGLAKFEAAPDQPIGLYESCGFLFTFSMHEGAEYRDVFLTTSSDGTTVDTHYYRLTEDGRFIPAEASGYTLDEGLEELNRFHELLRSDALGMNRHRINRAMRANDRIDQGEEVYGSREKWRVPDQLTIQRVEEVIGE